MYMSDVRILADISLNQEIFEEWELTDMQRDTADIRNNLYEGKVIEDLVVNGVLNPFEALTIDDGLDECPIHSKPFKNFYLKINTPTKTIGIGALKCEECNRLYFHLKDAPIYKDRLDEHHIKNTIYDLGVTKEYIDSLTPVKKSEERTPPPIIEPPKKKYVKVDYVIDDGDVDIFKAEVLEDPKVLSVTDIVIVSDEAECDISNHETEYEKVVITKHSKNEADKNYLCDVGYCEKCHRYYMSEGDFQYLVKSGYPDITAIYTDYIDDYPIVSGKTFEKEKELLSEIEGKIYSREDTIYSQPDYVNPFALDPFGSLAMGGLTLTKKISKEKYGKMLDTLQLYSAIPYKYRVDTVCEGKTIHLFLGKRSIFESEFFDSDLFPEDEKIVMQMEEGRKLLNARTTEAVIDGKLHKVKYVRQLDIYEGKLYGYRNLKSEEDVIFRDGVTDPFLREALKRAKSQHGLTDIYFSIQENQNDIVDKPFEENVIVQGCAGSGKTIIMLHRLSALKYSNPQIDFHSKVMILTPNDALNMHIKGVADDLQLGSINRMSVEKYYVHLLKRYDGFAPKSAVSSELFIDQGYVDYIYSDGFLKKFKDAYKKEMTNQSEMVDKIVDVANRMGRKIGPPDYSYASEFYDWSKQEVSFLEDRVREKQRAIDAVKKELAPVNKHIEEKTKHFDTIVKKKSSIATKLFPEVREKAVVFLQNQKLRLTEVEKMISKNNNRISELKADLSTHMGEINELKEHNRVLSSERETIHRRGNRIKDLYAALLKNKTQGGYYDFVMSLFSIIPGLYEFEKQFADLNQDYLNQKKIISELEETAGEIEKRLHEKESEMYAEETLKDFKSVKSTFSKMAPMDVFNRVFRSATEQYIQKNNINVRTGVRRCDLYARLLFTYRYYERPRETYELLSIDEGQDISLNEYRLIMDYNNKPIMNVFGDVNQLLKTGRGISDWAKLEKLITANGISELNENYRNTNQITRYCNETFGFNIMETGVDGVEVEDDVIKEEFFEDLFDFKPNDNRVAILLPRSVRKGSFLPKDELEPRVLDLIGDEIGEGKITLAYVDEVKGVEFDIVFAVSDGMTDNERYIAYTRALSELIIVHDPFRKSSGRDANAR